MKKKITLLAVMLLSAFSLVAQTFTVNGINYKIVNNAAQVAINKTNATDAVVIPATVDYNGKTYKVTSIADYAFQNNTNITSLNLADATNLETIGSSAFSYCSGLTGSLTIPNGVISIGEKAFYWCEGFNGTLTLGNSLTEIGAYAFGYCESLIGSLIIPNSVTSIENDAFIGCKGFNGTLTLSNSLTEIGYNAFRNCSGLTGSLTIPSGVTQISDFAFAYCGFTGDLTIPNGVTSIGKSAFDANIFAGSLSIPASVTSIGDEAFKNCSTFTKAYVAIEAPFELKSWDFFNFSRTAPLIVPCGKVDAYKANATWTKFFKIIRDYEYVITLETASAAQGTVELIQSPCETDGYPEFQAISMDGYEFSHWNDGNTENPRTVELTADTTFTANFQKVKYTITLVGDNGTITGAESGVRMYEAGTALTLTATPNTGYVFAEWSDGNQENPRAITVTGNETYTAIFASKEAAKITVNTNSILGNLTWGNGYTKLTPCDITVTNGATLTCDASETVASIMVEEGSQLHVTGGNLTITNMLTVQSEKDVHPQILAESALNYGDFQFVKKIPADRYYFFSLPFEIKTQDVTIDGVSAVYNTDWNFLYYDGAGFAQKPSNKSFWTVDNTGTIKANAGYSVGVAPGADNNPATLRDVVFAASGAIDFSMTGARSIVVAENPINPTNPHPDKETFKGWNFIMNPYTSNFTGALSLPGVSGDDVYISIPKAGKNKTYEQCTLSELQAKSGWDGIPPFYGFFVQVAEAGEVVFTPTDARNANAPRKANTVQDDSFKVGVILSNGETTDETTLVIGNQFTDKYEIGSDLMKMIGYDDKPQVYTYDANTKYAFHAINETAAAQTHPLGVYLPTQGEYTFSLKDSYDNNRMKALYLYDYETNASVNLMQTDYTFTTNGTLDSEKRFALSPMFAPGIATDLPTETNQTLTVWQGGDLNIQIKGVMCGAYIRVINLQGQVVSQTIATDKFSVCRVPQNGLYIVEVTNTNSVQVQKVMVQ